MDNVIDIGKIPPHAIELEEAVLGACMLEQGTIEVVSEILKAESFYKNPHGTIFNACINVSKRGEPVDILTVTQELKAIGQLENVGGAYSITQLTNRVASSANAEFHARIVAQKFIQRELIRINSSNLVKAYDPKADVFDLMDDQEYAIGALKSGLHIGNSKPTADIVKSTAEAVANAKASNGKLGPETGLDELDKILCGLRTPDVVVIAGRPAMGKTAAVLCVAKALAIEQKLPVQIFSLEMSSEQLMLRLLSDLSDIDNRVLASGKLSAQEQLKFDTAQLNVPSHLFIDDTPAINIQYFESVVRKKVLMGVKYFIIDYLQLMRLSSKDIKNEKINNRERYIAHLTAEIKRIAKKYNVWICELSQLSRECEERDPPRPMLSDLRESGAIEQDADIVILLYRPEYYNIEFIKDGTSSRNVAEMIVAKHRNGPVDSAVVKFIGEYTRFENREAKEKDSMASVEGEPQLVF